MLDYDGTLAPFKTDALKAYPYPGIEGRLAVLAQLPGVRLVLVSGRPARGLSELLNSLPDQPPQSRLAVEIWGNHGLERLNTDGAYHLQPLSAQDRETIEKVRAEITRLGFANALEIKPASLGIHWRAFGPAVQTRIRSLAERLYDRYAGNGTLHLLAFDGGLELRSNNYNKGSAVQQILSEEKAGVPAAYLGDDLTDEDAFTAIGDRGLSILVRNQPRPSAAQFWLQPPGELLQFLDGWIRAARTAAGTAAESASGVAGGNGQ